jgi:transcription termination factor Rho
VVRPPKEGENFSFGTRFKINGHDPQVVQTVSFEHLTPVFHQRNLN